MKVSPTIIPDVLVLEPKRFSDVRGFFSETYSRKALAEAGVDREFLQDNHSRSERKGVIRGLHFQIGEMAQDKLIRCIRGAILDVAVDIRHGSPTFGHWVAVELSEENWKQLLVPQGFAHGFATLVRGSEVCYKVSRYYSPEHDRGIRFDDPDLGIDWQTDLTEATLSDRDRSHPTLAASPVYFTYHPTGTQSRSEQEAEAVR